VGEIEIDVKDFPEGMGGQSYKTKVAANTTWEGIFRYDIYAKISEYINETISYSEKWDTYFSSKNLSLDSSEWKKLSNSHTRVIENQKKSLKNVDTTFYLKVTYPWVTPSMDTITATGKLTIDIMDVRERGLDGQLLSLGNLFSDSYEWLQTFLILEFAVLFGFYMRKKDII